MSYMWLLSVLPLINAYHFPCSDETICGYDATCCHASGFEWCCSIDNECCIDEIGCCLKGNNEVPFAKHFRNAIPSYKRLRKNPAMESELGRVQFTKPKRIADPSFDGFQMCDKQGLFYCRSQETCCEVDSLWLCCAYGNGTCCKDQEHCCPSGTTCGPPGSQQCNGKFISLEAQPMAAATALDQVAGAILCPDKRQLCEETNTCCLIGDDTYGCCPYQDAVCCADLTHCCPPDTKCHVTERRCFPPPNKI